MRNRKLHFFDEIRALPNVFEFDFDRKKLETLKNNWAKTVFNNSNPIVLELACGKGEYSNLLAKENQEINFIGIDIKGDRLCKAAKFALANSLRNVHFLRIDIQFIREYFGKKEIDELWITFPDPQIKGKNFRKRLSSEKYLNIYKDILKTNGKIHLKTDSDTLYQFTLKTIEEENHHLISHSSDLYHEENINPNLLQIQTSYEKRYLSENKKIKYITFQLNQ